MIRNLQRVGSFSCAEVLKLSHDYFGMTKLFPVLVIQKKLNTKDFRKAVMEADQLVSSTYRHRS